MITRGLSTDNLITRGMFFNFSKAWGLVVNMTAVVVKRIKFVTYG